MKGFFRYIPPFAPDYSGAVSCLFGAGGLVVLCDPGGCSGNVAGYDEPRFYGSSSAFFSAAIRELDSIFGRDDKLEQKIRAAAAQGSYRFLALVGTPVVSVIGTDLDALARKLERQTGIPSFAVNTDGMRDFSWGEQLAQLALIKKFLPRQLGARGDRIGVLGATPLNAVGNDDLPALLRAQYGDRVEFLSQQDAADGISDIGRYAQLISLSAGGKQACQLVQSRFGIPYQLAYPITPALEQAAEAIGNGGRVLLLHHQTACNALRSLLEARHPGIQVTAATYQLYDRGLARSQDRFLQGEDELVTAAAGFDTVAADPMYARALEQAGARLVPLPHRALSGELYL